MSFQGRHGVLPDEQRDPQPFVVDVDLWLPLGDAAAADDLSRSVDYAAVFDRIREVVESRSYRLVETLAEAITRELLDRFPIDELEVRVRKPRAPLPGTFDYVEVAIRRGRAPQS